MNDEHPGRWNDSGMAPGEWFKHRHLVEQMGRCYDLYPRDKERMIQAHELFLQLERERDNAVDEARQKNIAYQTVKRERKTVSELHDEATQQVLALKQENADLKYKVEHLKREVSLITNGDQKR